MADGQKVQFYGSMEGATYKLGRISVAFKTAEGDDDSAYTILETLEPPGSGAAYHRHPTYDERFLVCEGSYEFWVEGEKRILGPNDMVFIPRGTPHSFKCLGPETGRLLTISSPGGLFQKFLKEVHAAMVDSGHNTSAPAVDFRAIAQRHGMEFLPPPEAPKV
jgi:quercetin dioxygenase-like cupin family protein